MSLETERSYKRKHLRAPYKTQVLFEDENFVFKAETLNISEGGMLIDLLPHFPSNENVSMMISIPTFPLFKNFSLGKIRDFSQDIFPKKIVRIKCQMVRREGDTTSVDEVFRSRIGVKFTDIAPAAQRVISDYVNVFVSNIVHLQALLDNVNSDRTSFEKVRILSQILGYPEETKIALLRKLVTHDYKSLQWL
jgi:c-di-GMP-binding flagellar brake protein YcgR